MLGSLCCFDSPDDPPIVLVIGLQGSGKSLLVQRLIAAATSWQPQQSRCAPFGASCFSKMRTATVAPTPTDIINQTAPAPRMLPTIGTELQQFPQGFIIREVGGVMRQLWHHYYSEAAAVVFVLDAVGPDSPVTVTLEAPAIKTATAGAEGCTGSTPPAPLVESTDSSCGGDVTAAKAMTASTAGVTAEAETAQVLCCCPVTAGAAGAGAEGGAAAGPAAGVAAGAGAEAAAWAATGEGAAAGAAAAAAGAAGPAASIPCDAYQPQDVLQCKADNSASSAPPSEPAVCSSRSESTSQHQQPHPEGVAGQLLAGEAGAADAAALVSLPAKKAPVHAADVLQQVLSHRDIQGKPFCILVNKSDLDPQQEQQKPAAHPVLRGHSPHTEPSQTTLQTSSEHVGGVQEKELPEQQLNQQQQQQQQQKQPYTVLQASARTGAGMQALLQWLVCVFDGNLPY